MSFLRIFGGGRRSFSAAWLRLMSLKEGRAVVKKKILDPSRVRRIDGGFSFIPHRFLSDGFLAALGQKELLLYFFLVLVADRNGLSFYSYDAICSLLEFSLDEYIHARDRLIEKDLLAFDGTLFQVLSLPSKPINRTVFKPERKAQRPQAPTAIADIIKQSLKGI